MIPVATQADYELVHELGATSCIAASRPLAERFRAAGYRAEARRGWFCGVLGGALDLPHACVEVEDDDGALKTVDIAKAQPAARLSSNAGEFQELCLGSITTNVVHERRSRCARIFDRCVEAEVSSHSVGRTSRKWRYVRSSRPCLSWTGWSSWPNPAPSRRPRRRRPV
ncbi:hypothetical protein [Streptomyces sp. NPDC051677]|uniref:hypothetical protein n=1 Tax=Streptomyces sp. NPDC051677 TaxID=3365669 RepID=UPI0037D953ED